MMNKFCFDKHLITEHEVETVTPKNKWQLFWSPCWILLCAVVVQPIDFIDTPKIQMVQVNN
jgi:hypothetical protein